MAPVDPADVQAGSSSAGAWKTGRRPADFAEIVRPVASGGIRGDDIMTMVHGHVRTYFDPADPIDDRDIETIQSWAQTRDDKRIEDLAPRQFAALLPCRSRSRTSR